MLVFANNAQTFTLSAMSGLDEGESREDVVEVDPTAAVLFQGAADGDAMFVTISDPINAPGVYEVATLVYANGTMFTLRRSREYGDAGSKEWFAGAQISGRVTAELLGRLVQSDNNVRGVAVVGVQHAAGQPYKRMAFQSVPVLALNPVQGSESHQYAVEYPAGAEVVYRTRTVELGQPVVHDPMETYNGGEIVGPATPDGWCYQYIPGRVPMSTSGAVVFPGDSTPVAALNAYNPAEQAGVWVGTELYADLVEPLPYGFVLSELGFILINRSGPPSITPEVSVGVIGNLTKFLDHWPVAQSKKVVVSPDDAFDINSLVFTVETPGDDESVVGVFYFKGFTPHEGFG